MTATQRGAAIYGRVSDPRQEANWSLPDQERLCREYAAQHGFTVEAEHVWLEQGDSEELSRPGFQELIRAARQGQFQHLIIAKQDRLARNTVIHVALWFVKEAGLTPHCVTEPFDRGEIDIAVRALASGIERQSIKFRTQSGRRARARAGNLIPGPRPLYGYTWANERKGAFAIDPRTGPIVQRLFREVLEGRTLRQLAAVLDRDGVPTPHGARHWLPSSIRQILTRPQYWGVATACGADAIPLPSGVVPPLVTPDEAAAVAARLERNKAESARRNRDATAFLLRGPFLVCGCCQKAVRCSWKPSSKTTPFRPAYEVQPTRSHHVGCPQSSMAAASLDRQIWEAVIDFVTNRDTVRRKLAEYVDHDPTVDRLAGLERQLARVTADHKTALRRLALVDEDSAEEYAGLVNAKGQERRALEAERDRLVAEHAQWQTRQARLAEVEELIAALRETLRDPDELTYDERRDVLAMLDARVLLFPMSAAERWETLPLARSRNGAGPGGDQFARGADCVHNFTPL